MNHSLSARNPGTEVHCVGCRKAARFVHVAICRGEIAHLIPVGGIGWAHCEKVQAYNLSLASLAPLIQSQVHKPHKWG